MYKINKLKLMGFEVIGEDAEKTILVKGNIEVVMWADQDLIKSIYDHETEEFLDLNSL